MSADEKRKSQETIDKMLLLAKEVGIGDGTKEMLLLIGCVNFNQEAKSKADAGDIKGALNALILAVRGLTSLAAEDITSRRENNHL
jgi:hypothetical protein